MDGTHVVTCFLRNRGEVLALRRSAAVGSYRGLWAGVSGHAEGDPDRAAREEIAEETGLLDACALARTGTPFPVDDDEQDVRWVVHPYLFDCDRRDADLDWETAEAEWLHPPELLARETVPELWAAYSRVAPTIEAVAGDAEHGSAYLSVRALEVLRDRAGSFAARGTGDWSALTAIAERLVAARPSMAAVANRVNRAMAEASGVGDAVASTDERTPRALERAAREGIERGLRADERAAANAAAEIRGRSVLTLSRSGTVLDALPAADAAFVAESRPAREGVDVAAALADASAAGTADDDETASAEATPGSADATSATDANAAIDVTLHTDAAVAHVLATEDVDAVVVGADAVLPDGRVVNKTGTRAAALAAAREDVPTYAVAASDKVRTDDAVHLEDGDPAAVYDGDADVAALNPTFDVTPADLLAGVITERGVLDAEGVREVSDELRGLADWRAQ
ncbi:NUDIX domain-containing protein [Halorussus halobius]|uniref:NUDIX domain-containing protein n=1 Tax=Halorussus halobius TaxID=1710537 RepID=UPI0010922B64|nr:NUDIX domain-containing protein [Halorussus halobius]